MHTIIYSSFERPFVVQ